ncbi:hypothetical protein ACJQWK_10633 [Exserohilum turcicum]
MATYVRNGSDASSSASAQPKKTADNEIEMMPTRSTEADSSEPHTLNEANSVEKTGYIFSTKKKWQILTVVGLCQTSMSKWLDSSPQY